MRRSASEIINNLEGRTASLERQAIFGFSDTEEERSKKERAKILQRHEKVARKNYSKFIKSLFKNLKSSITVLEVDLKSDRLNVVFEASLENLSVYELSSTFKFDYTNLHWQEARITISSSRWRKDLVLSPTYVEWKTHREYQGMFEPDLVWDEPILLSSEDCAKEILAKLNSASTSRMARLEKSEMEKPMRRSASEIIHGLEMRVARLERQATKQRHRKYREGRPIVLERLGVVLDFLQRRFSIRITTEPVTEESVGGWSNKIKALKEIIVIFPNPVYVQRMIKEDKEIFIEKEDGSGYSLEWYKH